MADIISLAGAIAEWRARQPSFREMVSICAEAFGRVSWRKRLLLLDLVPRLFWLRVRIELLILSMWVQGKWR